MAAADETATDEDLAWYGDAASQVAGEWLLLLDGDELGEDGLLR